MLCLIPTSIPQLPLMLDDIGCGSARAVKDLAKALGVSAATVRKWKAQGYAPRTAMLAIFWLTGWGQNAVHCKAHNDAVMYAGHVSGLKREVAQLKAQLERVGRIGDFGSANDPAPGVTSRARSAPSLQFPPISFPEDTSPQPVVELQKTTGIPRASKRQLRG